MSNHRSRECGSRKFQLKGHANEEIKKKWKSEERRNGRGKEKGRFTHQEYFQLTWSTCNHLKPSP